MEVDKLEFKIDVPTDSEGFYSLECPHCNERFKALGGDIDAEEILEIFCPQCGLMADSSNFIPSDVINHAKTLALNYMQEEVYKTFKKTSRRSKHSSLSFKIDKPRKEVPKLLTEDENLEKVELICCNRIIKVNIDQKAINIYCPYCGVN